MPASASKESKKREHGKDTPHLVETRGRGKPYRPEEDVPLSCPMSWYPELRPPLQRKKEIALLDFFGAVDRQARQTPARLTNSFKDLVDHLTRPFTSDLEKLRAIFTWIGAQNLATKRVTASDPAPDTPLDYMKRASEGDSAYFINLFVVMCRKAGIPCMTVQGTAKGLGYEPGQKEGLGPSLWALVHVQDSWRFVHPHWAFKCVSSYNTGTWTMLEKDGMAAVVKTAHDEGEVQGRVEEFWFLTDPEEMNFFCHPQQERQQLLEAPWTMHDFQNLPALHCEYFLSPWKLLRPHTATVETKTGKCCIDLQHPENVQGELRYKLYYDELKSKKALSAHLASMDRYVTRIKSRDGMVSLITRLPVEGVYKIELIGVSAGTVYELGAFKLNCLAVGEKPKPFPANPETGFGFDAKVAEIAGVTNPSHTDGVMLLDKGREMNIQFQVQKDAVVRPKLLDGVRQPEELSCHVTVKRSRDQVQIGVTLPREENSPEYALEIFIGSRGNSRVEGGLAEVREKDGGRDRQSETVKTERESQTTVMAEQETQTTETKEERDDWITNEEDMGAPFTGRLLNALNYLLTCDEQLHEESKNETKEIQSDLESALEKNDEQLIKAAYQRFKDAGLSDPMTLAKVKAREAMFSNIREQFVTALQTAKSWEKLDSALNNFMSHHLHDDKGDVNVAMDKLMNMGQKAVSKALERGSVEKLGDALTRIKSSRVRERARSASWFQSAQQRKLELSVSRLCDRLVSSLDVMRVLPLCDRPLSKHIMAVLKTTCLLLGEDEEHLKDRHSLKTKFQESVKGQYTLKQKIKHIDINRIDKDTVKKAQKEMSQCNKEAVRQEGDDVLRLHDWCKDMVEELEDTVLRN